MARDTQRRLLALTKELEPRLARKFREAIREIKSRAQLGLLIDAIERGNIDDAIRILQIRAETFQALDDQRRAAFLLGAAYMVESLPKKLKDPATGAQLAVKFGGSQPRAAQIILQGGATMVTNLLEAQMETIRMVVAEGLNDSQPPRQIALDLVGRIGKNGRRVGGVIGLNERDALTVQRAKKALLDGDPDGMRRYLRLKGRDKRFDGAVRRALANGKGLTPAEAYKRAQRLSDRYLRARGEAIARTESIMALNEARREAVQQMIDRGVIDASQVRRRWDATGDARTREDHLLMEGQEVRWGVPFVAPDGSQLMGPGDVSLGATAKQVINCRCYEEIKVNWLAANR